MSAAYGKWIIGALVVAVVVSEWFVLRQNAQLRTRMAAESALDRKMKYLGTKTNRTLFEASMFGRCRPFNEPAKAPSDARPFTVSLYFSLDHDCLSCVQEMINQWNGMLKNPQGRQFRVTGYTEVDGTQDETILTRELKPAFPIVRIDHIEQKLKTMGVMVTPVVFVSDGATDRIILTSAPLPTEKSDRSLLQRLQLLLTPCGS